MFPPPLGGTPSRPTGRTTRCDSRTPLRRSAVSTARRSTSDPAAPLSRRCAGTAAVASARTQRHKLSARRVIPEPSVNGWFHSGPPARRKWTVLCTASLAAGRCAYQSIAGSLGPQEYGAVCVGPPRARGRSTRAAVTRWLGGTIWLDVCLVCAHFQQATAQVILARRGRWQETTCTTPATDNGVA